MLLFAVPSFYYLYIQNKKQKTTAGFQVVLGIVVVSLFAYAIETLGLLTGFPYSGFVYTDLIGFKIFDTTPLMLPFSFVPLVIGTLFLARNQKTTLRKILMSTGLLVAIDLMLDPAAVALGLWIWDSPGWYYGIPLVNFAGWVLAGFIASWLLSSFVLSDIKKEASYSLYLTLAFWTGACLWMQLWIPFIIGLGLSVYMVREFFLE